MDWSLIWLGSVTVGGTLISVNWLLSPGIKGALETAVVGLGVRAYSRDWGIIAENDAAISLQWMVQRFGSPSSWRFYVRVSAFCLALIALSASAYLIVPYSAPLMLSWSTTSALILHGIVLPNILLAVASFLGTMGLLRVSLKAKGIWLYLFFMALDVFLGCYFFALVTKAYWTVEGHIALTYGNSNAYDRWIGIKSVIQTITSHLGNPSSVFPFVWFSFDAVWYVQAKYSYFFPQIGMLAAAMFPTAVHLFFMVLLVASRTFEGVRRIILVLLERIYATKPVLYTIGSGLMIIGVIAEAMAGRH